MRHSPTSPRTNATAARGFTLIEMVMTLVLIGILAAVGAPMIANGMRVATTASTELATVSQLRYATERIAREIREVRFTGGAFSVTTTTAATFVFTKTDGTGVTINYSGTNVTMAYSGGVGTVGTSNLVTQATAFQFTYTNVSPYVAGSSPTVNVSLTLRNPTTGATFTQTTRVVLRNSV
jgi:prepilin-type N-terminal cleavage/methylation domain-containing protein